MWQFKRDNVPANNADLTIGNSKSFKYKAVLIGKTADAVNNTNSLVKNTKIVFPWKYLSNFWRSLEMPLMYWRLAKFRIMDAKLHVPIVTLSTKDNVNLTKQLSDWFRRSVYWYSYQTISAKLLNQRTNIYDLLSDHFKVLKD